MQLIWSLETTDVITVSSFEECLAFLRTVTGRVFFTTGSKNIADFERVRGKNQFVYRILPMPDSLEICAQNHVAMRDIVAMVGPVSEDLNVAIFQEYQAGYVIMKDSGQAARWKK